MSYFDACYIAKFYLAEPDSARVIAFAQRQSNISCVLLGKAEVIAVFHRKFRENIVDSNGYHLLCAQFETDCASGLWQWHPVDETLLQLTTQCFRSLQATTYLRASDALHLSCVAQQGFHVVYTSDRHMIAAAPAFGLQAISL